jgi:hypothetical protein
MALALINGKPLGPFRRFRVSAAPTARQPTRTELGLIGKAGCRRRSICSKMARTASSSS